MPTKSKSTKRRTKVQDIQKKSKELSGKEQKKIKGGILPYIEQDNLYKSKSIQDIQDGMSNTIMHK